MLATWREALYLRGYTSTDVVGVEIAGAVKNVIAIAGGRRDRARPRAQHHGEPDYPWPRGDHSLGRRPLVEQYATEREGIDRDHVLLIFSELPKTSTGKIQKFVLREEAKNH